MEILGWAASLNISPLRTWLTNERRALSPTYAAAELLWYLSGSNDIESIVAYAPQYVKFAQDDRTAHGAYGYRLATNLPDDNELDFAIDLLATKPNSRQAVCSLWRPDDLIHAAAGNVNDIPCTIAWQFVLRDDGLHMVNFMRSSDAWLGLPYDTWVNTMILRYLASELHVQPATYTHIAGSLHVYEKHWEAAHESITAAKPSVPSIELTEADKLDDIRWAVAREVDMRTSRVSLDQLVRMIHERQIGQMTADVLLAAGHQWYGREVFKHITSSDLLKGFENANRRRR